jgi:hypothetical protein
MADEKAEIAHVSFDGVDKNGEPLQVELDCIPASAFVGMKRSILRRNSMAWYKRTISPNGADAGGDDDEGDDEVVQEVPTGIDAEALLFLASMSYPDLLSCAVNVSGTLDLSAMTMETFRDLPDVLTAKWENAAYSQNAHWLPGGDDDDEKKETPPNSTSDDE